MDRPTTTEQAAVESAIFIDCKPPPVPEGPYHASDEDGLSPQDVRGGSDDGGGQELEQGEQRPKKTYGHTTHTMQRSVTNIFLLPSTSI